MRVVVLVLVVVVVVFVVSLLVRPEGSGDGVPGWLESLGDRVAPRRALRPSDLAGPCVDGTTMTVAAGGDCTVTVVSVRAATRTLDLRLEGGGSLSALLVPAEPHALELDEELDTGEAVEGWTVGRDGGTLTLRCADGDDPCTVVTAP